MNKVGVFNLGQNGRLGNQLFQIFSAWGYAQKYNYSLHLNHVPALDYLNIDYSQTWFQSSKVFSDKNPLNYQTIPYSDEIILSGYFQSPFYWDAFLRDKPEVLKWKLDKFEIADREGFWLESDYGKKNCFIHVRRGDYVRVSSLLLDVSYYIDAALKIAFLFGDDIKFHVFSDDIEWCKREFKHLGFHYHENNSDIEDIILMSLCDYGIMSNSSFSWWGGYMQNKKTCIYPKHWFNEREIDTQDICPEYLNWIGVWKSEYNAR
jgi:hypothetical protein